MLTETFPDLCREDSPYRVAFALSFLLFLVFVYFIFLTKSEINLFSIVKSSRIIMILTGAAVVLGLIGPVCLMRLILFFFVDFLRVLLLLLLLLLIERDDGGRVVISINATLLVIESLSMMVVIAGSSVALNTDEFYILNVK